MPRKSADRAPVAAHRLSPRGWTRIFTFLFVFVAFGGIAYGAIWYQDRNGDGNWWEVLPFFHPDPEPSIAPSVNLETTMAPSPSASPSAQPVYNFKVKITIYNDSKDTALGSEISALLGDTSEFTSISTKKWTGAHPPANVVRFEDPKLADTAAYIGKLLGIQTITSGPTSGPDIAVVLVDDPRPQPEPTASVSTSVAP